MLDRETFRKIRRIQIRTRVILESGIGGAYHAVFKGRGMEFAEVREYAPGDDVRTIDWNVTARMGAPYVKKFVEERDLTLLLLVDVSGSQALRLAVPAEARLRGRAGRGARLLGRGQPRPRRRRAVLRPHRGLRAARRAAATTRCASCATCWRASPPGRGTDLAGALRFAQRVLRRRGIVAVISDFQAEGYERALGVLRRRHDVSRCTSPTRARRTCPTPGSWPSATPRPARASWSTRRVPRCGAALRAPALRRGARGLQADARRRAAALDRRVVRAAALGLLQGAGEAAVTHAARSDSCWLLGRRSAGPARSALLPPRHP